MTEFPLATSTLEVVHAATVGRSVSDILEDKYRECACNGTLQNMNKQPSLRT